MYANLIPSTLPFIQTALYKKKRFAILPCFCSSSASATLSMEKSRVTEIKVRIDCNGCVQKIKKALYGVEGIEEVIIDLQQQKITITGSADPEDLMKAIKKTRKAAVICLHEEATSDDQQKGLPSEGAAPPVNPSEETPKKEGVPRTESSPPTPLQRTKTTPPESATSASNPSPGVEGIQVIHQHPTEVGYRNGQNPEIPRGGGNCNEGYEVRERISQPIYVAHGYSTHRPSTYVTEYGNPGYFHPVYAAAPSNVLRPYTTVTEFANPVQSQTVYAVRKQETPSSLTEAANPVQSQPVYPHRKQGPPPSMTETSNPVQSQPVNTIRKQGPPPPESANPVQSQPVYVSSSQRKYFAETVTTHPASSQPVYVAHSNEFMPPQSVSKFAIPASSQPNYTNIFRSQAESVKPNADQPISMTSHNTFRPIPSATENIYPGSPAFPPLYSSTDINTSPSPFSADREYLQSPWDRYAGFNNDDDDDYYGSGSENIASVFSEVNPNSCRIC